MAFGLMLIWTFVFVLASGMHQVVALFLSQLLSMVDDGCGSCIGQKLHLNKPSEDPDLLEADQV